MFIYRFYIVITMLFKCLVSDQNYLYISVLIWSIFHFIEKEEL